MPTTTLEGLETKRQDIVGAWWRRVFMIVLAVVVAAGLAGLLGVRDATAESTENGWSVRVHYAATARAGLDVPFVITVRHPAGLGDQVTLALTGSYFDIFETQAFHPEPSDETRDGHTLYLTFATPPRGDVFVVAYDAYIQPAAQTGRGATVAVVDSHGRQVAVVDVRTRLLP